MERKLSDKLWRRSDDCIASRIEDALVLLDLDSGQYVALNGTATDIWEVIAEPVTEGEIVGTLIAKYDIEAGCCANSVKGLLEHLSGMGLAKAVG